MTCNNIYEIALALLGRTPSSPGCDDYKTRTPLLFPIIVSRLSAISEILEGKAPTAKGTALGDKFPLSQQLAPIAAQMLAAMLIFDEQPELYTLLNDGAIRDMDSIIGRAAYTDVGSVKEVY